MAAKKKTTQKKDGEAILENIDASLLDIVDHVLNKGIVVTGDLVLGVADIDMIYLRVSAILCAADRVLGKRPDEKKRVARHSARSPVPTARHGLLAGKMGSPISKKR